MPVIYDPGRLLITAARNAGYPVTVVPGASAVTAAAALSGYSGDRLIFLGRLPRTRPQLDQLCSTLKRETATIIMFVHPPTLPHILNSIGRVLPNRAVTLAVNMTRKMNGCVRDPRHRCLRSLSLFRETQTSRWCSQARGKDRR